MSNCRCVILTNEGAPMTIKYSWFACAKSWNVYPVQIVAELDEKTIVAYTTGKFAEATPESVHPNQYEALRYLLRECHAKFDRDSAALIEYGKRVQELSSTRRELENRAVGMVLQRDAHADTPGAPGATQQRTQRKPSNVMGVFVDESKVTTYGAYPGCKDCVDSPYTFTAGVANYTTCSHHALKLVNYIAHQFGYQMSGCSPGPDKADQT